jgi:hypothetical protein
LTPCCGLEVQKPTQALQSVKDPDNTFEINLKWTRTFPQISTLIFEISFVERDLYKYPMKNISRTATF